MTDPAPSTRRHAPSCHLFGAALLIALGAVVTLVPGDHLHGRDGRRGQAGQSTVEYALILLGAAAVALVVVAWVTRTDMIGRLFDTVVGRILEQAA